MTTTLRTTLLSFVAGDTVAFDINVSDYSALLWTCQYVIGCPTPLAADAAPNGTAFQINIVPADTAVLVPGMYPQYFVFTRLSDGARQTVQCQNVTVRPNPTMPLTPGWAENALSNIEDAMVELSASTISSTTVNGQTFTDKDISALMMYRDRLRAEIGNGNRALGIVSKGGPKTIRTRFV